LILLGLSIPVIECGLRVFTEQAYTPGYLLTHPVRHYALRPNFEGRTYGSRFFINADGVRDDELQIPIRDQDFRIAVFGDSIAFGQGVELQQTFPKKLERNLNLNPSDSGERKYRVINLAVPGYNFVTQVAYLKEVFGHFKPKLLIFTFSLQQQTITAPDSKLNQVGWARQAKDYLRTLYSYVYFSSRFYSFRATSSATSQSIQHSDRSDLNQISEYYRDDYPGWKDCKSALRELENFCDINHIQLVMAIVGDEGKISPSRESDPLNPIMNKFEEALGTAGITHTVFFDDALRAYSNRSSEIKLRDDDNHYSQLAHQLTGDFLYQYLERNPSLLQDKVL
jgi:hypothetical protein